ncbi:ATP synthase subunit b, sodium ion specific [mine drainage metagenome]|uniref:ATP synthase subunit b, sodium ion specific n=1 Tax=mine drainage metagenome TaxID=410659 RepID=A0A1J5PYX5_9ZZZZ
MTIDWFTVGAQLLNFLILVWLLKRYLYKPVLDAIDAREQRIAAELAAALRQQAEAQKERDTLQTQNAEFSKQREAQMDAVRSEAKAERQRLLDEARQAADSQRAKRLGALESELQNLHKGIALRSREEVLAIANKVLGDLAGASVDQRMVEVLLLRLQGLGTQDKAALTLALKSTSNTVLVRSAFELSPDQRGAMQQALNGYVGSAIQARFETDPALISGIEISSDGWKLAWNIADFLTTLEQKTDVLAKETPAVAAPVLATGPQS